MVFFGGSNPSHQTKRPRWRMHFHGASSAPKRKMERKKRGRDESVEEQKGLTVCQDSGHIHRECEGADPCSRPTLAKKWSHLKNGSASRLSNQQRMIPHLPSVSFPLLPHRARCLRLVPRLPAGSRGTSGGNCPLQEEEEQLPARLPRKWKGGRPQRRAKKPCSVVSIATASCAAAPRTAVSTATVATSIISSDAAPLWPAPIYSSGKN